MNATLPVVDYTGVMQRLENDKELWLELIALFEETGPEQIAALDAAVASNDPLAIGAAAHALKGALGNLGAAKACSRAYVIEKSGKAQDVSLAVEEVPFLKQEISEFLEAAKQYRTA